MQSIIQGVDQSTTFSSESAYQATNLTYLFNPKSVAVVGASADKSKPGNLLLQNLRTMGFSGKVFPVNPNLEKIDGLKCYPSVEKIDEPVELVVILISPSRINDVAVEIKRRNSQRHDVKAVVCISGGFKELGTSEASDLEYRLVTTLESAGTRLIGPNCLGVIDTGTGFTTNFDVGTYKKGGASVITQSGAFGTAFLMWAKKLGLVGLNKFVSLGNMADVSILEVLEVLSADDSTRVIAIYMEGYPKPRQFLEKLKSATSRKPVVILKVGRTEEGRRAASSHTGSIAGNDLIYSGVLKQVGAIRASSVVEFYDSIRAFEKQPIPKGNRVAVLTHVGGPGTICLDAIGSTPNLKLATISAAAKEKLKKMLSPAATICRPEGYIDVTAAHTERLHHDVLEILFAEREVDSVVQILAPSAFLSQKLLAVEISTGFLSEESV